jgi:hypothetical protein
MNLCIISLILLWTLLALLPAIKILVSSAKNVGLPCSMQDSKSLIYGRNSTGPRTEPCGTTESYTVWVLFFLPAVFFFSALQG